jgi:hypothetical protein
MELALVLSLRIYHVVPDSVLHVVSGAHEMDHRLGWRQQFWRTELNQLSTGEFYSEVEE